LNDNNLAVVTAILRRALASGIFNRYADARAGRSHPSLCGSKWLFDRQLQF